MHFRPKGLLEVPANTVPSITSGWLFLRPLGSKLSERRYFLLLSDFVLYSYRNEDDPCAITATPLPGYNLATGAKIKGDSYCTEREKERVFKLSHPSTRRVYYFTGSSKSDIE